jgi:hypothetical protein
MNGNQSRIEFHFRSGLGLRVLTVRFAGKYDLVADFQLDFADQIGTEPISAGSKDLDSPSPVA